MGIGYALHTLYTRASISEVKLYVIYYKPTIYFFTQNGTHGGRRGADAFFGIFEKKYLTLYLKCYINKHARVVLAILYLHVFFNVCLINKFLFYIRRWWFRVRVKLWHAFLNIHIAITAETPSCVFSTRSSGRTPVLQSLYDSSLHDRDHCLPRLHGWSHDGPLETGYLQISTINLFLFK